MTINQVHDRLANVALIYFAALAVWGTWRFLRKQGISPAFWGATVIAELILALQGVLGITLWLNGVPPAPIHIMYGAVGLMALPAVYMYTKRRTDRPEMLMYAVVALITVGLIIRAMSTALPGG